MMPMIRLICPYCRANLGRIDSTVLDMQPITPSTHNPSLNKLINDIDWPLRTGERIRQVCEAEHITTVAQLIRKTRAELLRNPNFGLRSLGVIEAELRTMNLTLGMENDRS